MSIGRVVRAHRVPSEFHYVHKPYGQFQAMPLVHLKWQHERITVPSVIRGNRTPMRIGALLILILRCDGQFSFYLSKAHIMI